MLALHRLFRSFRARNDWGSHPARKAVLYALRAMPALGLHDRWLALLESREDFRLAARRDGQLLERWQHRWINYRLWPRERIHTLMDHYRCLADLLPEGVMEQLYKTGEVRVAQAPMKDGQPIEVLLTPPVLRSHEGELNLAIRVGAVETLFSMTVTLDPARNRLLIGCLQGPALEQGLERVRETTRLCHGLRPKNLLLSMAYALATAAGLGEIRGVSNRYHASSRSGKVRASYDTFWAESSGTLAADGFYALPDREPIRNEEDVASKHRSAFRQREALRQELASQLVRFLGREIDGTAKAA